jgi:hypothetical protein
MGEVTVSAKDKKKSKTDRDKRSEVRSGSDKDNEALGWAIRQSKKKTEEGQKRRPKKRKKWQRPWRNPGWRPSVRRGNLKPSPLNRRSQPLFTLLNEEGWSFVTCLAI